MKLAKSSILRGMLAVTGLVGSLIAASPAAAIDQCIIDATQASNAQPGSPLWWGEVDGYLEDNCDEVYKLPSTVVTVGQWLKNYCTTSSNCYNSDN